MKFKKTLQNLWIISIILCLLLSISGCNAEDTTKVVEKTRQVSVVTIKEEAYKETLNYFGFVTAKQIIPLSFQVNGEIEKIFVEEGDAVKRGDPLVALKKVGETTSTLYAAMDGVVGEIKFKTGELIGANYPVVLLRSKEQIMKIGVTDKDIKRLKNYTNPIAYATVGKEKYTSQIIDVDLIPDEASRTYTVTLSLETNKNLLIGELGTASIELSRISGYWLPISWILNDGDDYVYIVNSENRVERRNLKLMELNNDRIRVEGLTVDSRVITVGNSFVKEGQIVTAREAADE